MSIRTSCTILVAIFALSALPLPAQETANTLRLPAHVEPFERANIVAKASGFVSKVHVDIGDDVKQGEVLAELSIPEMQQEKRRMAALVEQAKAAIRQAGAQLASAKAKVTSSGSQLTATHAKLSIHQAEIAFARSELSRITTLVNSRAINSLIQDEKQRRLESAQASLASAEADVKSSESNILVAQANEQQAEADLSFAESQLKVAEADFAHTEALMDYATIRAPFDGKIAQRGIDTGDFVMSAADAKGDPLFTLNRTDRFRIVFDVPESSANLIQLGQRVELRVDSMNDQVFVGELKRTTGQLDSRTRTLRAEAEVEAETGKLKPGMYGMVTINAERSPSVP